MQQLACYYLTFSPLLLEKNSCIYIHICMDENCSENTRFPSGKKLFLLLKTHSFLAKRGCFELEKNWPNISSFCFSFHECTISMHVVLKSLSNELKKMSSPNSLSAARLNQLYLPQISNTYKYIYTYYSFSHSLVPMAHYNNNVCLCNK